MQDFLKPLKLAKQFFELPQLHITNFKIDKSLIQYTGSNGTWTHFIINFPINHNQTAKFKLKISQTHNRDMMIGIVDYLKQKDQRSSYNSGNAMCYYSYSNRKYP